VLGAAQGQTLSINVEANPATIFLSVYGADGTEYLRGIQYQTAFIMQLPRTQDYVVQLINTNSAATAYTLQVQIPSRVQFARGAISARVPGYVLYGNVNEYVLGARGGQTMTVSVNAVSGTVGLSIVGADGSPIKRYQNGPVDSWSGVLPATQDYYLEIFGLGNSTSYTLDITIVN